MKNDIFNFNETDPENDNADFIALMSPEGDD